MSAERTLLQALQETEGVVVNACRCAALICICFHTYLWSLSCLCASWAILVYIHHLS